MAAASSKVRATWQRIDSLPENPLLSPRKQATTGLGQWRILGRRWARACRPGGLDKMAMTSVCGSDSRAVRADRTEIPPIASERSRLPVPMA